MSGTKLERALERILTLFFSLPMGIVGLTVLFGPLASSNQLPKWFMDFYGPMLLSIIILNYASLRWILSHKTIIRFLISLIIVEAIMVIFSIYAGTHIHRDFFTASFQYIICVPAIVLYYLQSKSAPQLNKGTRRVMGQAGYILAAFYTEWIMLMGYAITTRAEPRPIESMFYNLFNLILVLILFFSSRQIKRLSFSLIEIDKNTLFINTRDITSVAGPKKILLLYAFASTPERRLRCSDIQKIMHSEAGDSDTDCSMCSEENQKAAQCSQYRTTYNTVLQLKKLLEFMEIGSITSSDNRRNILTEGWKFVLFENVRMNIKK